LTTAPPIGLLDTTVFIALETARAVDTSQLPAEQEISVVTIAELEAGVLAAGDPQTRARRLATLIRASAQEPLPIDARVASAWAQLRVHQAQARKRLNINDLWIAATAVVHRIPVVTQDDDFDPLVGVAGFQVIKV
jgi:predicted nucleic acid-binding protein